jgi:hypothetical protein
LLLTNVFPSNVPTKYWHPLPPAGVPPLMFTTSTQRVWCCGSSSIGSSNRSGHSQIPSTAPCRPNSPTCSHCFRLEEPKNSTFRWSGRATTITHFLVGVCQNTLGSRNSGELTSMTGLPSNFVHVRPRSLL